MNTFIYLLVSSIAVLISAYVLPGVRVAGFLQAFLVALFLGIVMTFIRPIILLLTLPVNIVTLGLFTFVINALLILLVSNIVPGFKVDNFWWALAFGLILSLVSGFLFSLTPKV